MSSTSFQNGILETPISLQDGGTGVSLADPNNDRILFWDDSAGELTWLTVGSGLSLVGTTLTASGVGSGTVTTVSVVSANGFAGTVATATTTPAITLTTSVTGILKGNGTAMSAAVAGTDYEVPLTFSTGLTRSTNTVTVNTSQNIATLSNLTTNGFVKTSGGTGALSIDTNTYLTGNQTITLSGDITGSGATSITTAIAAGVIVDADVNASAGIGLSKLATLTASRVLVSDGSGIISASSVTSTTLGYLDATSSIQTQLNGKQASGNYITALTGDVTASGPGSVSATIANDAVTYAKMQNVSAASKLLGRGSASGSGDVEEITLGSGLSMSGTTLSASGSGSGTDTSFTVAQTAHGFSIGDIVRSSGTAGQFTKAQANSAANAEVVGIVTVVTDANNFTITTEGYITLGVPVQAAGTVMFLDPSTAGALTATEPSTAGQVSLPLMVVITSGAKAFFTVKRGLVVATAGTGDVVGPGSATDNAIARFDGTTGKLIQNSVVTIADTTGNIAGVGTLNTHTIQGGTSTLAMYSNNLSVFAATTSAQLAGIISDETGSGALVFATGPSLTSAKIITDISDTNGNELIKVTATASAVNEFTVANAATGSGPTLSATGSDSNININLTPKGTGIVKGDYKRFMVRLLDSTTNQATGTTIGGDYRLSNKAITVKAVGCYCDTAGTTGTFTVDINEAGTSILSTKITVDSTEKSSETAATPPVISDTAIAADAVVTFDIDAIQTTPAKGLVVWIDYIYA